MSSRGGYASRGGGGDRGGRGGFSSRGSGGFGGRGGGRGGFASSYGPPDTVQELGLFLHAVESEMLCSNLLPTKVPYFNAPIYLENKTQIGKIDEILGPINEVYFTVKMNEGMVAGSFKKDDKIYIAADKLLPIERFLPKPKAVGGKVEKRGGRGGSRGAPTRGGRGGGRGAPRGGSSFGGGRGGSRGGFAPRGAPRGGAGGRGGSGGFGGGRGGSSDRGFAGRGRGAPSY